MVNGWNLDPAGIRGVLTEAQAAAQEFSTSMQSINNAAQPIYDGGGFDGIVYMAFAGFMEDQTSRLTGIGNRISAGLSGTASSTNAYELGDMEMANTLSSATDAAATTGDMTSFQGYLGGA